MKNQSAFQFVLGRCPDKVFVGLIANQSIVVQSLAPLASVTTPHLACLLRATRQFIDVALQPQYVAKLSKLACFLLLQRLHPP